VRLRDCGSEAVGPLLLFNLRLAKDLPGHGLQFSADFTRDIAQQVGDRQRAESQEAWRSGHIQQMANRVCPQTDQ